MGASEHCFTVSLHRGGSVSTVVDVPDDFVPKETPVVVLAHGAGADLRSEFMEFYATELCERGLACVRFNFPYMEKSQGAARRRPPDRMDVLVDCYQEVVAASGRRTGSPPGPLFIGGKSMGGRVATVLCALGRIRPSGFVLLGYPLHPAKKKDKLRVDHLGKLGSPALFVQGDRDPLCDLDILRHERRERRVAGALHVVPGGDHSFKQLAPRRKFEESEKLRAADKVVTFVDRVLGR